MERGQMERGQKIKFIGVGCKEQILLCGNTDPEGILEIGKEYTVKVGAIRFLHTGFPLKEVEGKFHPLWFEPVGDAELLKKPPLGLIPKWIHDQNRIWEIVSAFHRYNADGKEIPKEWVEEFDSLQGLPCRHCETYKLTLGIKFCGACGRSLRD